MDAVYEALRERLDNLGFGYPASYEGLESTGTEYALLTRFFSKEDAEVFLAMRDEYQTAAEFARESGYSLEFAQEKLFDMSKRGLLYRRRQAEGDIQFRTIPVAHGILEFNVNNCEKDYLDDYNTYAMASDFKTRVMENETPFYRAIPVRTKLVVNSNVLPYDDARALLQRHEIYAVADCWCRKSRKVRGDDSCDLPLETCISLGEMAEYYIENGIGRPISYNEALEIIESGAKDGRIVQVMNSQNAEIICSCRTDGCGILPLSVFFPGEANKRMSNYYCYKDESICKNACTVTCTKPCPTFASHVEGDVSVIDQAKCIGCGLCVLACQNNARHLARKPDEEVYIPPATFFDTYEAEADYVKKHR